MEIHLTLLARASFIHRGSEWKGDGKEEIKMRCTEKEEQVKSNEDVESVD